MSNDELKNYIVTEGPGLYFKPDKSGKGYICPICGSGTGKNGTGITTQDNIHFTCWAGCFSNSDFLDIIGIERGLTSFKDKLEEASRILNISLDDEMTTKKTMKNQAKKPPELKPEPEIDYTSFFLEANKNLDKTTYHRGITRETLDRFKVGYCEKWKSPKIPAAPASPRLIIPTSKYSYIARATSGNAKIRILKAGKARIFNIRAIKEAIKPIYITEGEIDALSVIDVGGEAIGLGSVNAIEMLLNILEKNKPAQPLIIALDNDGVGIRAAKQLQEGLEAAKIEYITYNPYGEEKDANDAMNANREAFTIAIAEGERLADEPHQMELAIKKEELEKEAASFSMQSFIDDIKASKTAACYSTGFRNLDKILDGGLYAGLYIVGAISSLGKTTLCLQIADEIAKQGKKVLIFSLEMSRNELIAKSISRLTAIEDLQENGTTTNAKTTRGILTGKRYSNYSEKENQLIINAIERYKQYANNIWIKASIGKITAEQIKQEIERFKQIYNEAPVVVVDYLQIIAPESDRLTDKQNTDRAVLTLKCLSNDYSIPVIGISSFNRDNYSNSVNLASFKESGAIEYSSDVLIGLQYSGMDKDMSDKEKPKKTKEIIEAAARAAREGKAQRIQVKILKNRNGAKGEAELDFYPMFNYFKENEEEWEEV